MAQKSVKKNYIFNLSYQVLLLLTPFITTPYLSRTLGASGIGQVSFAESVVSYFTLFATLGITIYGQREISYFQDSPKQRSIVFWNTKILEFCTAGIVLIIYLAFSLFQDNSKLYLILSLNLVSVFFDVTWLLSGLEEFGKIVFRNTILRILNIIYIYVFIKTENDVLIYAFGIAFFTCIGNLSLWGYLPKYVERVSIRELNPFKNIRVVISLFIPTIAVQIYTVLDKTMIGVITHNSFENGYYEQATKICRITLTLVTALGAVMIPRIGFYFQQKNTDEVKRLMYRGYRFVWFLGIPLTFGLCGISRNFVPWFFGVGFDKVAILIPILSFIILAIGINNVTGMQYLIPTKRQNIFTATVVIGAVVNICLNYFLIPIYASIGAALASIVAECVIAIVQIVIVRKELKPSTILAQGINYFVAGGIMLAVLLVMDRVLSSSIPNTIMMIVIGASVYYTILIIIKDEFFLSNAKSIIEKLKAVRGK